MVPAEFFLVAAGGGFVIAFARVERLVRDPYQNEPWHWEYNPPGFREIFWANFPGGAPERGIILDEP